MRSISWIHLTDLHCGLNSQDWLWPNVRQRFYEDLRKLYDQSGPWDIVFFSGDLTQRGAKDEFSGLVDLLRDLWETLDKIGAQPCLLTVPGNHDLLRPDQTLGSVVALKRWHKEALVQKTFWNEQECEYRRLVEKCFENYMNWLTELDRSGIKRPIETVPGIIPGDFSTILSIREMRIGVVGLNTAFLQLGQENYNGKLCLHPLQLSAVSEKDPPRWCEKNDLNFLMTHHPPDWLHKNSLEDFRSEVAPVGRFFLHVCGHLHQSYSELNRVSGSQPMRRLQGPSLFGLKKVGGSNERVHGYSVGTFDFNQSVFTLWPRLMVRKAAGHYDMGPDTRYDLNRNETITESLADSSPDGDEESSKPGHSEFEPRSPVEDASKGFTEQDAEHFLKAVPLVRLPNASEHSAVRQFEQQAIRDALEVDRVVWLSADWGLGKEAFLGAALFTDDANLDRWPTYRIDCEDCKTREDLLTQTRDQLGMTLQEFCAAFSQLRGGYLLFDNIMTDVEMSGPGPRFSTQLEQIAEIVLDYCPDVKVVLIGRTVPKRSHFKFVELGPLDEPDTRAYINAHPEGGDELSDPATVEQIYRRSEGMPMHIDRLLRVLKVLSLDELLELELETQAPELTLNEPVPAGLVRAIEALKRSPDRYARRSYRLLQILSVLPYGETFSRIRRFDQSEPLFPRNIEELLYWGLIQPVRVFEVSSGTVDRERSTLAHNATSEKKLVVPRQVRDYVMQSLTEDDLSKILSRAAELYFGNRWWEGKGRVPSQADVGEGEDSKAGPGNPHVVAYRLLHGAIQRGDQVQARHILHVAESYCAKLLKADLYRSACEALGELLHLLDSSDERLDTFQVRKDYGHSLRMLGRPQEAVEILRAVNLDDEQQSKTARADAYLNLSLALQNLGENLQAIDAAQHVKSLAHSDSALDAQASSIIIECKGLNDSGLTKLKRIEQRARQKGQHVVANNIALDLASKAKDSDEAGRLYRRVIDGKEDQYNRMRASFTLAAHLHKLGKLGSLSREDRRLINSAYALAYSQRMRGWLDSCHRALWLVFELEQADGALLRLFRYSSFVWRIYGKQEEEKKYLNELVSSKVIEKCDSGAFGSTNREKAYALLRVRRLLSD